MRVNGTVVEAKMCTFALKSTHFIFNKCPINTHDDASAKFITNSHKTDYSAVASNSNVVPSGLTASYKRRFLFQFFGVCRTLWSKP